MSKKSKRKKVAVASALLAASLLALPTSVMADSTSGNSSTPKIVSIAYDVGKGSFAVTGTGMVAAKTGTTYIDLTKVSITDGLENSYTLTSKGKITGPTTATISLNTADEAALAKIINNVGKSALNGGVYQANVMAGWDGSTSVTDFTAHPINASDIASLTSVTYDLNTGKLGLTGSNMATSSSRSYNRHRSKIYYNYRWCNSCIHTYNQSYRSQCGKSSKWDYCFNHLRFGRSVSRSANFLCKY